MLVLESEAIVGRILMLALRWVLFESWFELSCSIWVCSLLKPILLDDWWEWIEPHLNIVSTLLHGHAIKPLSDQFGEHDSISYMFRCIGAFYIRPCFLCQLLICEYPHANEVIDQWKNCWRPAGAVVAWNMQPPKATHLMPRKLRVWATESRWARVHRSRKYVAIDSQQKIGMTIWFGCDQ